MENSTVCLGSDFSLGPHQEEDIRVLLEGNNDDDDDEDSDEVKENGKKGELISETRPG